MRYVSKCDFEEFVEKEIPGSGMLYIPHLASIVFYIPFEKYNQIIENKLKPHCPVNFLIETRFNEFIKEEEVFV